MRKLIFVDNDGIESAQQCIKHFVVPQLVAYAGIEESDLNIEVISNLYSRDQDDLYELFYSNKNVILSWSVYTPTSYSNSKTQMLRFLRNARDTVRGATYIDMSGQLTDMLCNSIKYEDTKKVYDIMAAIENNNIITLADSAFVRLKINFSNKDIFDLIPVNLSELIK